MTYFPEAEVTAIVEDTSKVIQGDIVWQPDENIRGAQHFRTAGYFSRTE